MSERVRIPVVILMAALAGLYMYLNWRQVDESLWQMKTIVQGGPAPEVDLLLDGKIVLSERVHATGIFDAAGEHQLSFAPVAPEVFDRLKSRHDEVRARLNDRRLLQTPLQDHGDILQLVWDERKLSIVRDDDLRSIAANIWFEKKNRRDIIRCFDETFCKNIRVVGTWAKVQGPFTDTEFDQFKRGLPRGRWTVAPGTRINIQSRVEAEAWMSVSYFKFFPNQRVTFEGEAVREVRPFRPDEYARPYDGLELHPEARLMRIALKRGDNPIDMKYSRWIQPNARMKHKLAVYVTRVNIKPAAAEDEPQ